MSVFHQVTAVRFMLGAALVFIGGAAVLGFLYAFYWYEGPDISMTGLQFTEHMILCVSIGAGVFACAAGGYFLLRAVSRSRLPAVKAGILFLPVAIASTFLPVALMLISRAFWPDAFHGDAGWNFVLAPYVASPFVLGLAVMFIIGLIVCHRSHAKSGA